METFPRTQIYTTVYITVVKNHNYTRYLAFVLKISCVFTTYFKDNPQSCAAHYSINYNQIHQKTWS